MKLAQVQIKNFRCFESLNVPLQPDVNVFVGVNGSGKSSLLDAIVELTYPIALGLGKINPKRGTTKADRKLTVNDKILNPLPLASG
ncbi:MAG: AAA family ATPase [Thermodesulfobacteriota bacterium]